MGYGGDLADIEATDVADEFALQVDGAVGEVASGCHGVGLRSRVGKAKIGKPEFCSKRSIPRPTHQPVNSEKKSFRH
jgi:hypothetical protein